MIASKELAGRLVRPLAEDAQLRLTVFSDSEGARKDLGSLNPRVVIAEFECFGDAGLRGIAALMRTLQVPLILVMDRPSLLEREQLAAMGVRTILSPGFTVDELKTHLDKAITRRWRAGSDRLPVVSAS